MVFGMYPTLAQTQGDRRTLHPLNLVQTFKQNLSNDAPESRNIPMCRLLLNSDFNHDPRRARSIDTCYLQKRHNVPKLHVYSEKPQRKRSGVPRRATEEMHLPVHRYASDKATNAACNNCSRHPSIQPTQRRRKLPDHHTQNGASPNDGAKCLRGAGREYRITPRIPPSLNVAWS